MPFPFGPFGGGGGFGGHADAPPPPGRRFKLDRSQSAHAENWTGQDAYGNDPDYEGSKFERGAQGFGGAMHRKAQLALRLPQPRAPVVREVQRDDGRPAAGQRSADTVR